MMTQPAFSATLSPDELHAIEVTAAVWRQRGYARTADNLLIVAGLTAPAREPSPLPPNVFRLSDFRPRSASQAVSR